MSRDRLFHLFSLHGGKRTKHVHFSRGGGKFTMNCPSRTEEPEGTGMNQSPNALAADLTTRADMNGMANSRVLRRIAHSDDEPVVERSPDAGVPGKGAGNLPMKALNSDVDKSHIGETSGMSTLDLRQGLGDGEDENGGGSGRGRGRRGGREMLTMVRKFGKFVGPGFMISVAYIDPGNYATDVVAGATYRFRLLFVVLMSNCFAIFLQSLCIKLGTVSGLNLAEACRAFLPKWLNIFLYIMAEAAIIATDIAEVIGTAIAINLLIPKIPLVAGCALSIADVLFILLFYKPDGAMKGIRAFELGVAALVLGVVICFCIQLSLIGATSVGEVFRGYLPSKALIESDGLYQACGILGATVMPHSLYLGSGMVQSRLREYDVDAGLIPPDASDAPDTASEKNHYYPSLPAIQFCLKYSIAELAISLFTFALFVNSAILIVAGASLSSNSSAASADLFGIYDLLSASIAPAAGTIFALALLLSGISAGIVCTIAGQMVSEGAINWKVTPWMRRLMTRSISITPSIIIAGAVGRDGLSAALNGTQVALSVVLPFVAAPLIYFTCRNKYMTVRSSESAYGDDEEVGDSDGQPNTRVEGVGMKNHWITACFAVLIWALIAVMNVANLVLLGRGR